MRCLRRARARPTSSRSSSNHTTSSLRMPRNSLRGGEAGALDDRFIPQKPMRSRNNNLKIEIQAHI